MRPDGRGISARLKIFADWTLWHPIQKLLGLIPLGPHYALGWVLGNILYLFAGRRRLIVHQELAKSFKDRNLSPKERAGIIRKNFILFCKDYLEMLMYPKFGRSASARELALRVVPVIEGQGHIDEALSKEKGAILLHLHFGAMQMVLPALAHRGYRIGQLGQSRTDLLNDPKRAKNTFFEKTQRKRKDFEESLPATFFYIGTSVRDLIRWLQGNRVLDVAADGRNGSSWIEADFLGRKAYFPEGPFRLSEMTGAALLPTFIVRQPDNTHKVIIEGPLIVGDAGNQNRREALLKRFLSVAEYYVHKYPCHFCTRLWVMHREARTLRYPLFLDLGGKECKPAPAAKQS